MKAITVIQPWATLLASGKKRYETRSWKTNYRGEILIHAGKKDPLLGISAVRFMQVTMEICKKSWHVVTENAGTPNEWSRGSCEDCPFQVHDFGKTHLNGCILAPDTWAKPDRMRFIMQAVSKYERRHKNVKKTAVGTLRGKADGIFARGKR